MGWIIPLIFMLKAFGEFKYIGFFKRVKNNKFRKIRYFFSPLCLTISVLEILIQSMR
ncbi:DUF3995 domain-containing protein [Cellulophaga algicola]|uniref:DUF3995 domain-containing protein n=1 Tax=Cellulophaga algicola TaxID=59600 RepID=UPI000A068237